MSFKIERKIMLIISMLFFAIVALASIGDIIDDLGQGAKLSHIIQESVIVIFSLLLFAILFLDIKRHASQNDRLRKEIVEIRAISEKVSQELANAKREFGAMVARQFSTWGLTESESEIALFVLKGYSSKEIAVLRGTSEKTIRNQLSSIYQKSELDGKHSLIAWFMDGLF